MTKIIKFLFILTVCFFYSVANAQVGTLAVTSTSKDAAVPSPIFSYGDEVVYGDEFMRVFNKNKREENAFSSRLFLLNTRINSSPYTTSSP